MATTDVELRSHIRYAMHSSSSTGMEAKRLFYRPIFTLDCYELAC